MSPERSETEEKIIVAITAAVFALLLIFCAGVVFAGLWLVVKLVSGL